MTRLSRIARSVCTGLALQLILSLAGTPGMEPRAPASPNARDVLTQPRDSLLPSRDRVRRWRGSLAMDDRWGTWAYAGWDERRRAEFRRLYREAGYTHVALNFAVDYHASDVTFDFRSDPDTFARRLEELLRDGLVPVLSLAQAETYGRFRHEDPILADL
ncbi:MAG TPA: hypothetical protein VLD67_07575, partial [Vicinamibacterales bacterium]|nr:hypothetical protein [Vicinamibacterales bacterium]